MSFSVSSLLIFLFQIAFISHGIYLLQALLQQRVLCQIYVCSPCLGYPCLVSVFPKLLLLLALTPALSFLLFFNVLPILSAWF